MGELNHKDVSKNTHIHTKWLFPYGIRSSFPSNADDPQMKWEEVAASIPHTAEAVVTVVPGTAQCNESVCNCCGLDRGLEPDWVQIPALLQFLSSDFVFCYSNFCFRFCLCNSVTNILPTILGS